MKRSFHKALVASFILASAGAAVAAPTPMAGGANQVNGVSGTMSQVLFNGKLRLHKMTLQEAKPSELSALGSGRALVFRALVSNGTHAAVSGYFNASIVDADGVTVHGSNLAETTDGILRRERPRVRTSDSKFRRASCRRRSC